MIFKIKTLTKTTNEGINNIVKFLVKTAKRLNIEPVNDQSYIYHPVGKIIIDGVERTLMCPLRMMSVFLEDMSLKWYYAVPKYAERIIYFKNKDEDEIRQVNYSFKGGYYYYDPPQQNNIANIKFNEGKYDIYCESVGFTHRTNKNLSWKKAVSLFDDAGYENRKTIKEGENHMIIIPQVLFNDAFVNDGDDIYFIVPSTEIYIERCLFWQVWDIRH